VLRIIFQNFARNSTVPGSIELSSWRLSLQHFVLSLQCIHLYCHCFQCTVSRLLRNLSVYQLSNILV